VQRLGHPQQARRGRPVNEPIVGGAKVGQVRIERPNPLRSSGAEAVSQVLGEGEIPRGVPVSCGLEDPGNAKVPATVAPQRVEQPVPAPAGSPDVGDERSLYEIQNGRRDVVRLLAGHDNVRGGVE
jgi:hypothetical protein